MTLGDLKQEVDKAVKNCGDVDKANKILLIEPHEGETIDIMISVCIGNTAATIDTW